MARDQMFGNHLFNVMIADFVSSASCGKIGFPNACLMGVSTSFSEFISFYFEQEQKILALKLVGMQTRMKLICD